MLYYFKKKELQKMIKEPHTLKGFFEENEIDYKQIAKEVDYSETHIFNVLAGNVIASGRLEKQLERLANNIKKRIDKNGLN